MPRVCNRPMARPGRAVGASCLALLLFVSACDNPFGSDADRAEPRVTLSSPTAGLVVDADSVVVEGVAEDNRGVERVAYRLDGGPEVPVQVEPARSVSFRVVLRDLTLGTHELEVLAYDAAERVGDRTVAFSTRDAVAPSVEVSSPADGELVGRDSVRITGTLRDDWKVASLSYAIDGGQEQEVAITAGREAGFTFTVRGTAPGEHELVLRARDEAGNVGEETVRFTTSAAEVRITTPRADTTANAFVLNLRGEITSAVPLQRYTYSVNGGAEVDNRPYYSGLYLESSEGAYRYTFSGYLDSLPQGPSTVRIFAYDEQGRKVGVASTTVTVSVPVKQYTLTYLGTLGGNDSQGAELNEKGQVTGWSHTAAGAKHAFAWDGSRMIDIGRELGVESSGAGINESGEVVGSYRAECQRSFRYTIGQEGNPRRVLDDCGYGAADVNDAGTVLLAGPPPPSEWGVTGFLLGGDGLHRLSAEGAQLLEVFHVNNRNQVLAAAYNSFFGWDPVLLTTTAAPVVLGVCAPVDLNDAGQVAIASGCKSVTFGWNGSVAGKRLVSIGYPNPTVTNPSALNNHGHATGAYLLSLRSDGQGSYVRVYQPFFWDGERMHAVEHGDPDWVIDGTSDINDAGVILAHARNTRTGKQGAVLLTPKG